MSKELSTLEEMRAEMDRIDDELMSAFRKRMELSAQIARYKKDNNIPVLDVNREKSKLDAIAKAGDDMSAFASKLYLTLADLSKTYQAAVTGGSAEEDE